MSRADDSRFTRVSILGSRRNADVVVPSSAPLDLVMSQIAQVLGEDARQNYTLVRLTGGALTPFASLAEQEVEDGAILQLTRVEQTPPSPTIFDLSEAAESASARVANRWVGPVRRRGLALVAGVALILAILTAVTALGRRVTDVPGGGGMDPGWIIAFGALVMVLMGSALWWLRGREAGRVLAGCGAAFSVLLLLGGASIGSSLPLPWLWALGIGGLAALGTTQRVAGWIAGLATLAVVVLAWYGLMALTGSPFRTGGLLGTFCLLILGVMPQIALGTSGVFAAQREQGEMPRARADDLVVRAHDVLRTTVAVLGGTIAVCALQMALDPETNAWGFGLLLALMVGAALRLRPFPLASQKLALWAPLVVGTAALGARAASMEGAWIWAAVAALVVLALALLLIAHLDLPEHVRAQLRQMGNSLEGITLVTTIPVAVGMFGIYADLLRVLNP